MRIHHTSIYQSWIGWPSNWLGSCTSFWDCQTRVCCLGRLFFTFNKWLKYVEITHNSTDHSTAAKASCRATSKLAASALFVKLSFSAWWIWAINVPILAASIKLELILGFKSFIQISGPPSPLLMPGCHNSAPPQKKNGSCAHSAAACFVPPGLRSSVAHWLRGAPISTLAITTKHWQSMGKKWENMGQHIEKKPWGKVMKSMATMGISRKIWC